MRIKRMMMKNYLQSIVLLLLSLPLCLAAQDTMRVHMHTKSSVKGIENLDSSTVRVPNNSIYVAKSQDDTVELRIGRYAMVIYEG